MPKPNKITTHEWISDLRVLAKTAGARILDYFGQEDLLTARHKQDHTIVTKADQVAHEIILQGLSQLTPSIPVLSEEGEIPEFAIRKTWQKYWLVDPLDGTRGFVQQSNEFTVNIALIDQHVPILGLVYAPVQDVLYFAAQGQGACRFEQQQDAVALHTRNIDWQQVTILLGHYHRYQRLLDALKSRTNFLIKRLNSSLKFCWLAEGRADVYPRFGVTNEWDSAAAQCILTEAGGAVVDFTGQTLQYNAKNSLENPAFIALGDRTQLQKILQIFAEVKNQIT